MHQLAQADRVRGSQRWNLIAALSLPIVVLLTGAFELFPVPGWVDPLIYAGYFLDAKAQIEMFGAYYFSNRVPFIFIGSLVHEIFEPTTAHLALVFLWQLIAIISIFVILSTKSAWPVAVLGCWWLGANPLWIASLSSGYVDAPAIAMGLAVVALLMSSLRRSDASSWLKVAGSGVLFSFVAALHPLPALIVGATCMLLLVTHERKKGLGARIAVFVLCGMLGILLLGLYSFLIGGPFWFLLADLTPVSNAFSGASRRFIKPAEEWLGGALRLGLPIVIASLGLLLMVDRHRNLTSAKRILGIMGFVALGVTLLLLGAWDAFANGLMLQTNFYASYLLLGQALLAGFIIVRLNEAYETRWLPLLGTAVSVVAVTLALLFSHEQIWDLLNSTTDGTKWWGLAISTVILIGMAGLGLGGASTVLLFAITILVGMGNADTRVGWKESGTVSFKQIYELALSVRRTVDEANLRGRRVQIWLDRSSFTTGDPRSDQRGIREIYIEDGSLALNAFDSIAALWLWDKGTLNFEMPILSPANLTWLRTPNVPTSIVMICVHQTSCNEGHLAMDAAGIPTEIRTRAMIWKPGLQPITVLVVDYFLSNP